MILSIEETAHVAHLARLQLDSVEIEHMRDQLAAILDYFAMLEELDVTDVPRTAQVTDLVNALREDVVTPSLPHAAALANARTTQDGAFRVGGIFDE